MNLKDNPILYVDMINSLQLGAKILYEDEHAFLIQDQHSSILYCSADDRESAKSLVEQLPKEYDILVSHDEVCNQALLKTYGMHYENRCYHCAYLHKSPLTIQLKKGYEIKELTKEYLPNIIRLYQKEMPELANEEYMLLCMKGGMYGVFEGNTLCGFISVHTGGYGSIGMLEIEERYRKQGFGTALERYIINVQLRRGRIPYGEIFIENKASINLQEKVGMQVGKDLTYWFYQ